MPAGAPALFGAGRGVFELSLLSSVGVNAPAGAGGSAAASEVAGSGAPGLLLSAAPAVKSAAGISPGADDEASWAAKGARGAIKNKTASNTAVSFFSDSKLKLSEASSSGSAFWENSLGRKFFFKRVFLMLTAPQYFLLIKLKEIKLLSIVNSVCHHILSLIYKNVAVLQQ